MVLFGGPGVMLLGIVIAFAVFGVLTAITHRRLGWDRSLGLFGLLWSVAVLFVITLVPTSGVPRYIPPELAQTRCSLDYGGPAPDGFWIIRGGQRMLNVLVFMPSGILLAWTLSRFRHGLAWLLPALAALIGCSVLIELIQLKAIQLGRACDVTDMVDNATGAVLGVLVGLVLVGIIAGVRRLRRGSARSTGARGAVG